MEEQEKVALRKWALERALDFFFRVPKEALIVDDVITAAALIEDYVLNGDDGDEEV